MLDRHYPISKIIQIYFGYIHFYSKIYQILYPQTWNSTTNIATIKNTEGALEQEIDNYSDWIYEAERNDELIFAPHAIDSPFQVKYHTRKIRIREKRLGSLSNFFLILSLP